MMLATDTRTPPTGEYAWEIKYDGIRAQIYKNGNKISIFSRSGRNITERFPELV